MQNLNILIMVFVAICLTSATSLVKDDDELIKDAKEAKTQFLKLDESMEKFFNTSHGYAIFPNMGKGAFLVGGGGGKGVVWEQGAIIGTSSTGQITVGLQAGGSSYRLVIFFENEKTMNRFKANKFEFAANMSAVAAASGASMDAQYVEGILVFAMSKGGLMAEMSIGGQKFKFKELD